ncbi:aKG-HExxH-type peptide beta-hydroxylase [Frankia sp. EI5c]|uniref:aKG-HExxH-type peptide beta-hydroxylase n=1 Tax=Frankia sp. EI5c TaxID=683316 RepID=UPI0037BE40F2
MDQVDLAGPLDPVLGRELGHAGAVAAAAALRAGIPFDLPVHIRDGAVTLPGLGVLRLGGRDGWARVSSAGEGGFVLWPPGQGLPVGATATTQGATTQGATRQGAAGPGEQGHWIPLRVLEAGNGRHRFRLTVDDLDPNRDCQVLAVAARLDRRTVQRWSALLVRGWPLVVAHDPAQAAAMGAGLSTLVPLDDRGRSRYASATCSDALGAVAATTPHDPTDLAVTLVHEFAHFKLGALLDLVELHDGSADAVHYAPWRADPRPVGGLLQGAYAFLAVAGFWRSRALASTGAPAAQAAFEFAWCREAVRRALAGLRSSGRLTRLGERFTAGMTARLDQWAGVPVPPAVRRWAIVMNDDVQIIWRLRHRRPDPAQVAAWASAWQRGAPWDPGVIPATPAASGASARVHAGPRAVPRCAIPTTEARTSRHPRQALVRAHLADPRLVGSGRLPVPEGLPGLTPGALTRADVLLIAGNHEAAAQGYAARLAAGMPGVPDLAAFAGLAVARRLASATGPGFRPGPETAAFVEHPEVLYGLTRWFRDRTGRLPDVDALAAWVGGDPRARRGYRDGRLAEHPAGTGGRLH